MAKNTDETIHITVDRFHSFAEVTHLQLPWDQLVENTSADIFLTFDWCRIWWNYYGKKRELALYVFRCQDEIVGILPLFFDKVWLGVVPVKIVKIVGADFSLVQFALPLQPEYISPVISSLLPRLAENQVDLAQIGPMAGNYNLFENLKNAFADNQKNPYQLEIVDGDVQTYFIVTDNWESYLAKLNKRERQDVRRNYRYLEKVNNDPPLCHLATENSFEEYFEQFVAMHQEYWLRENKAGHFGDWPDSHDFHKEVARQQLKLGRLRLMKISSADKTLGFDYTYKCGPFYYEILNARSTEEKFASISLGKIVFAELMQHAINEKVTSIDSMRGRYDHKIKMGGELFNLKSYLLINRNFWNSIKGRLFIGFSRLLNFFYYRAWYCKLAPKIKIKNKGLWQIWIRTRL